ncbi:MAG: glycosyltransferase [Cyanobacteria bacterium P01_F01_bin.143]
MKVIVALEHRFARTPDGSIWTESQFPHSFWTRYLEVFDQVGVVARVKQVSTVPANWKRADGDRVSFANVPHYIGPWQYLLKAEQVKQAARKAVRASDAVILRVSSQISQCIEPTLRQTGQPYAVEVVADPYDVFAPGSVKNPLRPFFRWFFPRMLRRTCAGATSAAYVTEHALQRRYPPAQEAFSTHYSSVELPEIAFVKAPRSIPEDQKTFTLVCVGTLGQLYKAQDVLIDAIAICVKQGLDLKLVLVGDGKHREELENQARELGIGERVEFRGWLAAGDPVRQELDRADLFVLPSHQEGLPRAMIEAMARGLPCIGSNVGGIPELIPTEEMVAPGDITGLANKISEVVSDTQRMENMSVCNLEKAKNYRNEVLRDRRNTFYRYLKEKTQAWALNEKH